MQLFSEAAKQVIFNMIDVRELGDFSYPKPYGFVLNYQKALEESMSSQLDGRHSNFNEAFTQAIFDQIWAHLQLQCIKSSVPTSDN